MATIHTVFTRLLLALTVSATLASCKDSKSPEQTPPAGDVGGPAPPSSEPVQPSSLGPNSLFASPAFALDRQRQHNHFFMPKTVLDLQDNDYATAERPEGLSYEAFHAIGHGVSTAIMIVGPDTDNQGNRRVVIIDTLENNKMARQVGRKFLQVYKKKRFGNSDITKLPIAAIIYSHNHLDHTGGIEQFLDLAGQPACPPQDPSIRGLGGAFTAQDHCVDIIGHENITDAVINTSTVSGPIIQARSLYMYGAMLPRDGEDDADGMIGRIVTAGVGPPMEEGIASFRMPSRTFADELQLTAAGVSIKLVYVPSETNDELIAFLPDHQNTVGGKSQSVGDVAASDDGPGLLFSAEVVQGPAYPNLYSLRGTKYRSPATWFRGVDVLRTYDAWCMIPGHGPPICGRDNVNLLLTNFRDAIQYTHDQTVRLMNKGYLPEEMARMIEVPEILSEELSANLATWPNEVDGSFAGEVNAADYLVPFYGSVPQSVRVIYQGYLGWFQGDPWDLWPTPRNEAARRMAALASAQTTLTQAAADALNGEDWQWAAELATIALDADPADVDARRVKIAAYTALGARAVDANWSHWYYTSANELRERDGCFAPFVPVGLIGAPIVSSIPVSAWVDSWMLHYKGRAFASASTVFGFWIQPTDFGSSGYILRERHGIIEVEQWSGTRDEFLADIDVGLGLTHAELKAVIQSTGDPINSPISIQTALLHAIDDGKVQIIKGERAAVDEFFGHFDDVMSCQPTVSSPRTAARAQMANHGPGDRDGHARREQRAQPSPMAVRVAPGQ